MTTKPVYLFNQHWYSAMISQVLSENQDASPDARAITAGIMTGGAFIAEAIAHAFEEQSDRDSVTTYLRDIAGAIDRLAESMEARQP